MTSKFSSPVASAPCLLASPDSDIISYPTAPAEALLLNGLRRAFGICLNERPDTPEVQLLGELAKLFQLQRVDAETPLEKHDRPWGSVYLIQYGVLRLSRRSEERRVGKKGRARSGRGA